MNHAERRVAVLHRIGDHAQSEQIKNLVERPLLLLNFQMQRIKSLHPRLHLGRNAALDHLSANRILHFMQKFVEHLLLRADFLLDVEKRFRLEVTKREIFQFAANQAHPEPVCHRSVNIERLARDALLLLGIEKLQESACCAAGPPA